MTLRQWRSGHIVVLVVAMIAGTLGIASDGHAQGKIRIAVTAFENKTKHPLLDSNTNALNGVTLSLRATKGSVAILPLSPGLLRDCFSHFVPSQ